MDGIPSANISNEWTAVLHCAERLPRGHSNRGSMNSNHQLPKGHTSILSPAFMYVPAASTDVARTFARVRGQQLQPQPAPSPVDGQPDIEVLEASWLSRSQPGVQRFRTS
jgi:hypothetical protein